jgi:hypothetical protein
LFNLEQNINLCEEYEHWATNKDGQEKLPTMEQTKFFAPADSFQMK